MRAVVSLVFAVLVALFATIGAPHAEGEEDLDALNRQVGELHAKGKKTEALDLAKRYVALTASRYGDDSLDYATAATWLACLYQAAGDDAEAEKLFKRALLIREKVLGGENAQVAASLRNLASLYKADGRADEAAPLFERAAAIRAKAQGSDALDALRRQAEELHSQGKTEEAIPIAEQYRDLVVERYGEAHPDLTTAMALLMAMYRAEGRTDEAAALELAISARGDAPLPDDARFAETPPPSTDPQWRDIFRKAPAPALKPQQTREAALPTGDPTQPSYAVVKVYYATDRKKTSDPDPAKTYGGDRGDLTLGICTVSIPRDHRMGEVEKPSIWRLEWSKDPERHVVLLSVTEQDKPAFFGEVADRARKSNGGNAFVFVHGYNVAFADAARRTAQMTYDLGFDGAPIFYSWPSQAAYAAYKVDETNAEWSEVDLRRFLKEVLDLPEVQNVFLIAHSMGARVLTGALKELLLEQPQIRAKLKEIILAAPDIDADTFKRDIAPRILSPENSATLYASSGDYALIASKAFAGYQRAGDTADGVTVVEGLDTIDASGIRADFIGHSYYGSSASVLGDLRNLILSRKRAEERSGLKPVEADGGRYWSFSR